MARAWTLAAAKLNAVIGVIPLDDIDSGLSP
jgi:hypothetical protein